MYENINSTFPNESQYQNAVRGQSVTDIHFIYCMNDVM